MKFIIYEVLKYEVEIDTDDINLEDYHKGSELTSIARTLAYKKNSLYPNDSKIIYTKCFREDSPPETITIHEKNDFIDK